jgi:WD repeat-containing protein 19
MGESFLLSPGPLLPALQVTLTDGDTGDTLRTWQLKAEPQQLAAAEQARGGDGAQVGRASGGGAASTKLGQYSSPDQPCLYPAASACQDAAVFSVITDKRTLHIFRHGGGAPLPAELGFPEAHGALQRHAWLGDGLVMLGFRSGRVVVVSAAR